MLTISDHKHDWDDEDLDGDDQDEDDDNFILENNFEGENVDVYQHVTVLNNRQARSD